MPDPAAEKPAAAGPESSKPGEAQAKLLTPEEQMALFEQHLKENDWGHQPC
jgi:hypothetical protein